MKVIILAAGRGDRLMPLTRNTPKSLLTIGEEVTLLESQLTNIAKCGIRQVCIVTGYLSEQIESKVKSYSKNLNISVNIVYNPFYDEANNLISLWFAKHQMGEDFIVVNGDDVFSQSVLKKLLKSRGSIVMVIDKKSKYYDEDMKVITRNKRVLKVSKKIPINKANGESVGIIRFRSQAACQLKQVLEGMVRKEVSKKVFWLEAVQQLIDKGIVVDCVQISPKDWAEIDFHPDLHLVKGRVLSFVPLGLRRSKKS